MMFAIPVVIAKGLSKNWPLKKLSDLGLPCLSEPFCQATNVQNLRAFTVHRCHSQNDDIPYFELLTSGSILCL